MKKILVLAFIIMSIFTGCISELSKTEEKVNEETLLKRLSEPDNYYSKIDITYKI